MKQDEDEARVTARDEERRKRADDANDQLRALRGDLDVGPIDFEHRSSRDVELEHRSSMKRTRKSSSDTANTLDLDKISNMRFKDAAGRGKDAPWYSNPEAPEPVGKDVWGNEDINRKKRDEARLSSNDPLLSMRRGVKQLRSVEQQRLEWRQQRERDLNEVEDLAREERRRHRHRHRHDRDSHREGYRSHSSRHRSRSPRR